GALGGGARGPVRLAILGVGFLGGLALVGLRRRAGLGGAHDASPGRDCDGLAAIFRRQRGKKRWLIPWLSGLAVCVPWRPAPGFYRCMLPPRFASTHRAKATPPLAHPASRQRGIGWRPWPRSRLPALPRWYPDSAANRAGRCPWRSACRPGRVQQ